MKLRSQLEHKGYNSTNYPGTRQLCVICDSDTERCEEDDLYVAKDDCEIGPLCIDCFDNMTNNRRTTVY